MTVDGRPSITAMLVQPFAILAILSGTALPLCLLGVHAYRESQIPHCHGTLPSSVTICTDAITGLKYEALFHRLPSQADASARPHSV